MKRVMGYALAFTIGTMVSGSVVFAATNYVQAQRNQSSFVVNGQQISTPDSLVYNGSTYVQLYSFQQGLQQLGMSPSWDGHTFSFTLSAPQTEPVTMTHEQFSTLAANVLDQINSNQSIIKNAMGSLTSGDQTLILEAESLVTNSNSNTFKLRNELLNLQLSNNQDSQIQQGLISSIDTLIDSDEFALLAIGTNLKNNLNLSGEYISVSTQLLWLSTEQMQAATNLT